jgi:uncharacterized repeat protein (TIGR03833 family)
MPLAHVSRNDADKKRYTEAVLTVFWIYGRDRDQSRSGIVKDILTNTSFHPHGIKVRLIDGRVGRVRAIIMGPSEPEDKK